MRRLRPDDCIDALTDLLHGAFAPLGRAGLQCRCVDQTPATTRARLAAGEAFVAVRNVAAQAGADIEPPQLLGTITVCPPDPTAECRHYRMRSVAIASQLAVAPVGQARGLGSALLRLAEAVALARGHAALALDTPWPARHLVGYYQRRGFELVDVLQFRGRGYRSAVLRKWLQPGMPAAALPPVAIAA